MKNKEFLLIICPAILFMTMLGWANGDDEDYFKDYCKPGLCKLAGGDGIHTGCKDGKLHDGNWQVPPCKPEGNMILNLTDEMKQEILDIHNFQRNYVACGGLMKDYKLKPACRMGAMKWDRELEAMAYVHVTYCTMEHDKCRNTVNYPFSGQNLGWLNSGKLLDNRSTYTALHMMAWYMEYKLTWPEVVYNYSRNLEDPMIGHFLTSGNEANTRVGCVLGYIFETSQKKQSALFTCNYPMTNIKKHTMYNPCKVPASKCKSGTDPKYKYLCTTNEEYVWSKPLKLEEYDGDDTDKFKDCGPKPEDVYRVSPDEKPMRSDKPDLDGDNGDSNTDKPLATDKYTTKKPSSGQWPSPPETPSDKIVYDYEEDEYDPLYMDSSQTFKECFFRNIFRNVFVLAILLIKIFGI